MTLDHCWILATLAAAAAQTGRNAAQRGLTVEVGTLAATGVRFVFGLPFAALFLALIAARGGVPAPTLAALGWAAAGGLAQIAATALMLAAMRSRGFGVVTALMKTEPVSLALLGALLFAEPLGAARLAAIAVAVTGVVLAAGADWRRAGLGAVLLGVGAGALFGVSALAFRAGILALPAGDGLARAAVVLVLSLSVQSALFGAWFAGPGRAAWRGVVRHLRPSLGAGFLGALASQFWFLGFALTSAANVRTLALIEVPLAALVSRRLFAEGTRPAQLAGMALIVVGVAALIRAA